MRRTVCVSVRGCVGFLLRFQVRIWCRWGVGIGVWCSFFVSVHACDDVASLCDGAGFAERFVKVDCAVVAECVGEQFSDDLPGGGVGGDGDR